MGNINLGEIPDCFVDRGGEMCKDGYGITENMKNFTLTQRTLYNSTWPEGPGASPAIPANCRGCFFILMEVNCESR